MQGCDLGCSAETAGQRGFEVMDGVTRKALPGQPFFPTAAATFFGPSTQLSFSPGLCQHAWALDEPGPA